ncbi:ester cyclase [Aquirufa regiilacus]
MKKILMLLVTAGTLFSCTTQSEQNEKIAAENIAFYSRVWEVAINEGRTNILDTAYAENVVLHTVPETKGKAAAKAYYDNYVTGFSDREFIIKETFASGNKLVKYWQFKGKHIGNFFGIPATGKSVDVIGCTIATIIGGKITEEQDFFDNLAFFKQLGIQP